ncbi:hypothetical protein E1B28_011733 [Marasmius oreades]|uniref:Uncharacterized protein n=1 Tax=Marasmius oreades TaxID=181124 RepID=A0A9P7USE8_9AGAR|nr:uncharacterized protein E1B28_011733 [Marasmius oreades]KAG7090124.1 hypothetical protein E1B28_011733 [Marasmius oreades]
MGGRPYRQKREFVSICLSTYDKFDIQHIQDRHVVPSLNPEACVESPVSLRAQLTRNTETVDIPPSASYRELRKLVVDRFLGPTSSYLPFKRSFDPANTSQFEERRKSLR